MNDKKLTFRGYTYTEGNADKAWADIFEKVIQKRLHRTPISELNYGDKTGNNITACEVL